MSGKGWPLAEEFRALKAPWDCGAWHPELPRWCTEKLGHTGSHVSENQRSGLETLAWPRVMRSV